MPRMNGLEFLAAVKADERTRYLPVILLSARAGSEAAVEGLEAGAGTTLLLPSFYLILKYLTAARSSYSSLFVSYIVCLFSLKCFCLDDYLIKPFGAKELLARVSTHLELSRLRRQLEHLVEERTAKVKKVKKELGIKFKFSWHK